MRENTIVHGEAVVNYYIVYFQYLIIEMNVKLTDLGDDKTKIKVLLAKYVSFICVLANTMAS